MKLFISYASEDRAAADELAVRLQTEGHDVFLDRDDLPRAESYDARIRAAIAACDLYLFLVSPHSVKPGRYVLSELGFARERFPDPSGRVLPVMIAPTPFGDIDPYLKAVTLLDPKGNWIAETLASVGEIEAERRREDAARQAAEAGRRRKRGMLLAGAALLLVVAGLLVLRGREPGRVAPQRPECRLRIEASNANGMEGLALDVTTPAGTQAYRLTAAPLELNLGPLAAGAAWQLLLRGRDGSALGEHGFSGCPVAPASVDLGGGHGLLLSPVE